MVVASYQFANKVNEMGCEGRGAGGSGAVFKQSRRCPQG